MFNLARKGDITLVKCNNFYDRGKENYGRLKEQEKPLKEEAILTFRSIIRLEVVK